MKSVIPTVAVVVFKKEFVLLVKHGEEAGHLTGTYGLPAGRIERGESSEQSALRELKEETGLTATKLERLPTEHFASIKRKDGTFKDFSLISFKCMNYEGQLKSSEETDPEWVSLDRLGDIKLLPNVNLIISEAVEV